MKKKIKELEERIEALSASLNSVVLDTEQTVYKVGEWIKHNPPKFQVDDKVYFEVRHVEHVIGQIGSIKLKKQHAGNKEYCWVYTGFVNDGGSFEIEEDGLMAAEKERKKGGENFFQGELTGFGSQIIEAHADKIIESLGKPFFQNQYVIYPQGEEWHITSTGDTDIGNDMKLKDSLTLKRTEK